MGRKNNCEIRKRKDGRWCATFYDDSPEQKRHYVYGHTKAEVKAKLKDKKNDLKSTEKTRQSIKVIVKSVPKKKEKTESLENWMIRFLEKYKRNELKESTYGNYLEMYQKHILGSRLGKMELDEITSEDLQDYYNSKREKGYNPKSIQHIHTIINSTLEKAVQLKMIKENPNKMVILPKKQKFHATVLSSSEVRKIVEEAKEDELYPIVALTLYTGLRKGEIMALKWENINFEKKELYVEGSLCRVMHIAEDGKRKYDYKILNPKTEKSKRVIPLMDIAIEALEIQKKRQELMEETYKSNYHNQGFVFSGKEGSYMSQRPFMKQYHNFLKKYGISDVRFHDLRHTFASLMLEAGESPKIIQELLGHSTITTTMDIYTHITKQGKVNAIQKYNDLIEGKEENK